MSMLYEIVKKLAYMKNNFLYKRSTIHDIREHAEHGMVDRFTEYNEQRDYGFNTVFCKAPFSSLYFKYNGEVVACCKNNMDVYGNIKDMPLDDIWNSAVKLKLQDEIKSYSLGKGCSFCEKQLGSCNYSGVHARIFDEYSPGNSTTPEDVTFEVSNKCNLECIMCDGYRSSSIRKNREKLQPFPNAYPDDFLQQLMKYIPYFKNVRLQGGEPFLIPFYLDLIDAIVKKNSRCKVYIQTNGTILTDRIRKIIGQKNIYISISVDAFNREDYEYIRKNANFDKVMANILEFKEALNARRRKININYCVLKNNIFKIHEALDFVSIHDFDLEMIMVENPSYLSLKQLTSDELEKATAYLNECIIKYPAFRNNLTGISNYLHFMSVSKAQGLRHTDMIEEELYRILYDKISGLISVKDVDYRLFKEELQKVIPPDDSKAYLYDFIDDIKGIELVVSNLEGTFAEYISIMKAQVGIISAQQKRQ